MPCLYRFPVDPTQVGHVAATAEESRKSGGIDAILAVIIEPVSATPAHATVTSREFADGLRRRQLAGMPRKRGADQPFEPSFGGVGYRVTRSESAPR